jgi:hypothetical protein
MSPTQDFQKHKYWAIRSHETPWCEFPNYLAYPTPASDRLELAGRFDNGSPYDCIQYFAHRHDRFRTWPAVVRSYSTDASLCKVCHQASRHGVRVNQLSVNAVLDL